MVAVLQTLVAVACLAHPMAAPVADWTDQPDWWTCGAQDWGPNEARLYPVTEAVSEGANALSLNFCHWAEHYFAFPKWRNAGWNLSAVESLEFRVKLPQGTAWRGPNPTVYLRDRKGRWVRIRPAGRESLIVNKADGAWHTISVPLRPDPKWERFVFDSEPTDGVDWIEIAFNGGAAVGVAHSVQLDGVRMLPESPAYAPPDESLADLDVLIVERSPLYERYNMPEYDPKKEIGVPKNARAKHEPSPGERVTFTATVQNKGRAAAGAAYEWRMDGRVIGRGTLKPLPPRARATATMEWRWDPGDHDLTFALVSAKPDSCPANDALTIRTNALMLKFQIERGLVARMESKTNMKGSYSCEDWLQGQLEYMNQLFRISTYPFAPNGITQRVMVGKFD
jgi:hypothetical protein